MPFYTALKQYLHHFLLAIGVLALVYWLYVPPSLAIDKTSFVTLSQPQKTNIRPETGLNLRHPLVLNPKPGHAFP